MPINWDDEEAKELAEKIRGASKPWDIISQFHGDMTIFVEESVTDAICSRINSPSDLRIFIMHILSDDRLGLCKYLVDIVHYLSADGEISYLQYADEIVENASDDVLKGPIQEDIEFSLETYEDVIPLYSHLIEHPILKNNSKLIEAVLKNKDGIRWSILELPRNEKEFESIVDIPEILCSDEVIDAIHENIFSDGYPNDGLSYFRSIESLQEKKEFWVKLYRKFEESKDPLGMFIEPFNLEWLLSPKHTDFEDISAARKRLIELIKLRGWELMRLSLLSEVYAAESEHDAGIISELDLLETRNNFFTILGVSHLDVPFADVADLFYGIEWRGSFENLKKDIGSRRYL